MVLEGTAARLAAAQQAAELGPLEQAYREMEQAAAFAQFVEADALFRCTDPRCLAATAFWW